MADCPPPPHPPTHTSPLGIRSGEKKEKKAHLITSATSNSNWHYGARQLAIVNTDSARRCYLGDTIAERRGTRLPSPNQTKMRYDAARLDLLL